MNLTRGIELKKIADKMGGSSGAELKACCTEAGMFALRERRVHVTQEDFEMAVAKVGCLLGQGCWALCCCCAVQHHVALLRAVHLCCIVSCACCRLSVMLQRVAFTAPCCRHLGRSFILQHASHCSMPVLAAWVVTHLPSCVPCCR